MTRWRTGALLVAAALAPSLGAGTAARADEIAPSAMLPDGFALLRARALPAVRRCYTQSISYSQLRAGRLTVALRVERDGAVTPLGVEADTLRDEPLKTCILDAFARVRLGPRADSQELRLPLAFAPGS